MRRGELWWADLPDPTGSEPGFKRPVIVLSANPYNESALETVIVAIVTSNLALGAAPGNVRVSASESGLKRPSVINVTQLFTVNKSRLRTRVRLLPSAVLNELEAGLKQSLALR